MIQIEPNFPFNSDLSEKGSKIRQTQLYYVIQADLIYPVSEFRFVGLMWGYVWVLS
jgi:hypothetical protein